MGETDRCVGCGREFEATLLTGSGSVVSSIIAPIDFSLFTRIGSLTSIHPDLRRTASIHHTGMSRQIATAITTSSAPTATSAISRTRTPTTATAGLRARTSLPAGVSPSRTLIPASPSPRTEIYAGMTPRRTRTAIPASPSPQTPVTGGISRPQAAICTGMSPSRTQTPIATAVSTSSPRAATPVAVSSSGASTATPSAVSSSRTRTAISATISTSRARTGCERPSRRRSAPEVLRGLSLGGVRICPSGASGAFGQRGDAVSAARLLLEQMRQDAADRGSVSRRVGLEASGWLASPQRVMEVQREVSVERVVLMPGKGQESPQPASERWGEGSQQYGMKAASGTRHGGWGRETRREWWE